MEYLTTLNDKQQEAVLSTEGNLRVIAGAGSGKTKLLVSRYAYLVKEYGIDPANILCVTFTNKAAGEMKRRIRSLIGPEYDTSLICTYHGFCVRVLREDIEKIFYPKEFQIIDTSQQKAILADIYQKFELKLDHASFEKIIKQIGAVKAKRSYVSRMCCTDKCQISENVNTVDEQIIEEYLQMQKQIFAMDFDDLLFFTLDIFYRCPEVLQKWQDRLNYIQVDEFQDSSNIEMELVDTLAGQHGNMMIVGDPDQNIYEWRGSDVKLLVDFDKTHENTKTVFLNQNYRSTPQILKCANTLIEKNEYRLKKDLFTKSGDGECVMHFHMKNEYAEADKIIEQIRLVRKQTGCDFADFAVLYRSGFLSRVIEKKFTECGIPYEIFGGVKFYQRMEIQDVMAYLRLIAFDDDVSFKRIINTPRRRFGRAKMLRLMQLRTDGQSLFNALVENAEDSTLKNSGASDFVTFVSSLRERYKSMSLSDVVEVVCSESGYERYIRELGDMERFENLSEFKRIAAEYEKSYGESVSLKEFINQISLQSEDDGETVTDMVKLMTVHASKGLEFPNVFIIGLSEGVFPSAKTIEERKKLGLEEERRLCYVAITRAEKRLYLLDSEGYNQNNKQKLPSRFLKEIGEENYIRVGAISKELQQSADEYAKSLYSSEPTRPVKELGSTVHHPAFGEGRIIGFGKNKNSYRIRFDERNIERDISADFFNRPHSPIPIFPVNQDKREETQINKDNKYEEAERLTVREKDKTSQEVTVMSPALPENTFAEPEEIVDSAEEVIEARESAKDKPRLDDYENLWKRDDVPKSGWVCTGISDLGEPVGVCEMCGHQIIRYVHHMKHPDYRPLNVGCICAGKMEGDVNEARRREQEFKSRQARRENFKRRNWKTSRNNNSYLKIKDRIIVLYYNEKRNNWKYSLDNVFCTEVYATRDEAMDAAFDAMEGR